MNRQLVLAAAAGLLVGLAVGRYTASLFPAEGSLVWVKLPTAQPGDSKAVKVAAAPTPAPEPGQALAGGTVMDRTMPSKGPADAPVVMVEISDFECPFCARVGPTVEALLAAYPKDLRVVWSNNPLPFHAQAMPAAMAAMAAHRQGRFWQMHDKLFAGQADLSEAKLRSWAQEIGLDMAQFDADRQDENLRQQITREQRAAKAVGAEGTPGFLINGRLVEGAVPIEQFKEAIEAALAVTRSPAVAAKQGFERLEAAVTGLEPERGPKFMEYFVLGAEAPGVEQQAAAEPAPQGGGGLELPPGNEEVWRMTVSKDDQVRGDNNKALVTIVAVSDFQCPFCATVSKTVEELQASHGEEIRVVFKHFPLSDIHPAALGAHAAAIAAAEQGKFWEFHDQLFAHQDQLTEDNYVAWAREMGLDVAKFDKTRQSKATRERIEADIAQGRSLRVDGTPHTFINGRKLAGALPVELMTRVIDEELAKARQAGRQGAASYDELVANGRVFQSLDPKVNTFDLSKLPALGKATAPHTLVVFSDFQCPYCKRIAGELKALQKSKRDQLKVVFAHYPLPFHDQARPAHILAQEAFAQGGEKMFWKVHDALFEIQEQLTQENIEKVGTAAGLDMGRYAAAKADQRHDALIEAVMKAGQDAGVEGTPNLFIDGRRFLPMAPSLAEAFDAVLPDLKR